MILAQLVSLDCKGTFVLKESVFKFPLSERNKSTMVAVSIWGMLQISWHQRKILKWQNGWRRFECAWGQVRIYLQSMTFLANRERVWLLSARTPHWMKGDFSRMLQILPARRGRARCPSVWKQPRHDLGPTHLAGYFALCQCRNIENAISP